MKASVRLLVSLVAIGWATTSGATLIIEPVINSVPGSGPTDDSFPLYDPVSVNHATGEHPWLANRPGEIDTVSIGNPPDPDLLIFSVWNNTSYDITSLRLSIIGSALHPTNSEDAWLVTRDPSVDAFFGDADGDGKIGLSDIFSSIVVSDGGKTITLDPSGWSLHRHFLTRPRRMAFPSLLALTRASTVCSCQNPRPGR
jgi:hypothetical protein